MGWVVMGGTKFIWQPVTDSVSQGSILEILAPVLVNIILSELGDGAECPLDSFLLLAPNCEGWVMCQRVVVPPRGTWRQESYKVQQGGNKKFCSREGQAPAHAGWEQGKAGKNLGVLVDTDLNMSHQQRR